MIKKVRKETIPLSLYLSDVKNGDISKDQDVQRGFCSDNSFVNEIAVTILTEDYLPPVILGEIRYDENLVQKYVVDIGFHNLLKTVSLNIKKKREMKMELF